jgi:hypothetical protein
MSSSLRDSGDFCGLEAGAEPAWTGSKEDGGRLLTIPYSMLSNRPTSPADLIADLFTGGVLIALGGDGQTSQIPGLKPWAESYSPFGAKTIPNSALT